MKFAKEPEAGEGLQIAAMVDVVFILLSFFVLASQFRLNERDVAASYSSAQQRKAAIARGDLPGEVPVVLTRRGERTGIRVGEAVLGDDDFAGITRMLATINVPEMGVRVSADRTLSVDQVTRAMDAVLQSPMRRLSLGELAVASPAAPAGGAEGAAP